LSDDIERLLASIGSQLDLDAELEREVIDEIRGHLEDAAADAEVHGVTRQDALAEAAARFGVTDVGLQLHSVHEGQATADGVVAASLPVVCALVLRWLVFSPGGTAVNWRELLIRPAFWVVAGAALLVPMLRFTNRRYALVSWTFFWVLSVIFALGPALRW